MKADFVRPKLLIVDDRAENILALKVVLRDGGCELVEAHSGFEALELARRNEFAAILLDVQMPGLDGFETAKLLRTFELSKQTPIIFVTAIHQTEAQAHRGYDVGAIDYLFKPINADILKAKVQILVDLYKKNLEIQEQSRKLQEQKIREAEYNMLQEKLRARDEFLSMASHELKTPITPLNLQLQVFLKMVREKTLQNAEPERLERMLEVAYGQVERLSETIDKLLDVSRFATGRIEMHLTHVDLSQLVKKAVMAFDLHLKKMGYNYTLQIEPGITGEWDPFRIEQVIFNLISNAIKYGEGKPLRFEVRRSEGAAEIIVQDQGIGIAPENQQRIFHRFERAVSSAHFAGLGLGLYISCEIIKHHGGQINVESRLGEGALFRVTLPFSSRADQK